MCIFRKKKQEYRPPHNLYEWSYKEHQIKDLINTYRGDKGHLFTDKNLYDEATIRCDYMIEKGYITHDGAKDSFKRLKKKGLRSPAEILQYGHTEPQAILDYFKRSERHNKILLSPLYKYIGICNEGRFTCIMFGR